MALTTQLFDRLMSHVMSLGLFETVNSHEPKSAPGQGLHAAFWLDSIGPIKTSGLASSSGLVTFNLRMYGSMLTEPQDAIDPAMLVALDGILAAYSGDFTLDGLVRQVDLLGAYGPGLSARAGYLEQGGQMFRVMTVTLPLVVNDIWNQVS